ncbi:MAG TPA: universal stress protein [Propionibacteriaceae bacterium]|nr:universal stress protein [Propionibacteriaceae bacterium]
MTVVVAYLPTPEGEAAFAAGLAESDRRSEPLLVLNSPHTGAPISKTVADEPTLARLRERAAEHHIELDLRLDGHTDDLVDLLLTIADEVNASVIVIGLRHRTAVGKLLMGSNAQRILLQTKRPVLAVKA